MLRSNLNLTGEQTIMRNRRRLLQSVWSPEQQATALNSIKIGDREGKMNTQNRRKAVAMSHM